MSSIGENKINRIDIKEFREMGLLVEVNRTFFHPLGLALEVIRDDQGEEVLGGIWDYRDDPEGILYNNEDFPTDKMKKAQEFIHKQHQKRKETLGYIMQEPDEGE